MQKYPDIMPGDRFGSWTVLEEAGRNGTRKALQYLCKCDCGTERIVWRNNLVRGLSKSCGRCQKLPNPWIEQEKDYLRYHYSEGDSFIFSPCDLELAESRKWIKGPNGYAIDKACNHFSRIAMGANSGEYVDHISMDISDERRENLRICSWSENNCNKVLQSNNNTGYKGVSFHKQSGKYMASLWKDGKHYYGGLHNTPEDGAMAYDRLARKMHGEYARLNFPGENERSCRATA